MYLSLSPSTRAGRPMLAGALLATTLLAPTVQACSRDVARVDVYDRSEGSALEVHHHRGRQYVVGRPGNEYAIRIRNCSDRSVLSLIDDGLRLCANGINLKARTPRSRRLTTARQQPKPL